MTCHTCGRELTKDETGLTRKLVSRAAVECYCLSCLGDMFHLSREQMQELIHHFRESGCTLFL